jgi:alkylated DNA repair protein alkB family protein 7
LDFKKSSSILHGSGAVSILHPAISEEEHEALVAHVEPHFRRRRYQEGHWDSVITRYREVEIPDSESYEAIQGIVAKIRRHILSIDGEFRANQTKVSWLPVHAIDLSADGFISKHVDSIKFSGEFVAGLSLLSSAVMRLTNTKDPSDVVDMLLPPRSLYILRAEARYDFEHEILCASESQYREEPILRGRRLSLIFRDTKLNA